MRAHLERCHTAVGRLPERQLEGSRALVPARAIRDGPVERAVARARRADQRTAPESLPMRTTAAITSAGLTGLTALACAGSVQAHHSHLDYQATPIWISGTVTRF